MRVKKRGLSLVALSVLLIIFSFLAFAESGCYTYADSSSLYCQEIDSSEAQLDCNDFTECVYTNEFIPGSDCAEIPACQQVICSLDCLPQPISLCELSGGRALTAEEEPIFCDSGCCQYQIGGDDRCRYASIGLFECLEAVSPLGLTETDISFDTSILTQDACLAKCDLVVTPPDDDTLGAGTATISGTVSSSTGPLEEATVYFQGPSEGSVLTNLDGTYQITALSAGNYTLTASKRDYTPSEKEVTLTAAETLTNTNFILTSALFQGVSGTTFVAGEATYGVSLYVDGVFKGLSNYPDGNFQIRLDPGPYNIQASYQDYQTEQDISITTGQLLSVNLYLSQFIGECSLGGETPQKNVADFFVYHLPGEEAVRLEWSKPCPQVSGYVLDKVSAGEEQLNWKTLSPADSYFVDEDVEWGKTYIYKIKATYTDGNLRTSDQAAEVTITLGDKNCQDRYHENNLGWETFCLTDDSETTIPENQLIYTCNDQNQIEPTGVDCSISGPLYFCAKTFLYEASCKNAEACSWLGNPFGLYHTRNTCYGTATTEISTANAENFCYYDSSNTIADSCQSCTKIKSCFDFQSQDACLTNNCVDQTCRWVSGAENEQLIDYGLILPALVTPETGVGYCVEEDYQEDNQCSLCGPEATLFENYFCTADVCSSLGRCFSDSLTACQSCGDTPYANGYSCYSYTTESECTGSQPLVKDDYQRFTLSDDQCSWERCLWKGSNEAGPHCVKDGDGDNEGDCELFLAGEREACSKDNLPPKTKVIPEGLQIISTSTPELIFQATDQNSPLGTLGYCLTQIGVNQPDNCLGEAFIEKNYDGRSTQEIVTVDFLDYFTAQNMVINGETWKLKFYSQDKYFNQEDLQETFVYVDNVPPPFLIKENITTTGDLSNLNVYLDNQQEAMTCTFTLNPILPFGSPLVKVSERKFSDLEIEFADLNGVRFNLEVTCLDDFGNENKKTKDYVFNLDQNVQLVYPPEYGSVASTDLSFQVQTTVGSFCSLYQGNTYLTDFTTNAAGKEHITMPITVYSGPTEDFYQVVDDYSVLCKDLLTNEEHLAYFLFYLDFTDVSTKISLEEPPRKVEYLTGDWEEYFIASTLVSLECQPKDYGLGCGDTYYCLDQGEHCQTYTQPFFLNQSARICYYSLSETGGEGRKDCGDLVIDGYGITLENPEQYFFQNEKWGITNEPIFDWKFFTRIPTLECGFNWLADFNYATLEPYKVALPYERSSTSRYLFEQFPDSVFSPYAGAETKLTYVQCKDDLQKIGPEQKLYLEYDPTAPEIEAAYADPELLIEGTTTDLFVNTDDKTLCKFSDNSSGAGSSEYATMEYSFPAGNKNNHLEIEHQTEFTVSGVDDSGKKDYSLQVQCTNGAGDLSPVEPLDFKVDYTALGYIIPSSLQPSGFIPYLDITLSLETSKNAYCEYSYNGTYRSFIGGGSRVHQSDVLRLIEKAYQFPIKCFLSDQMVYEEIKFTIDLTAPAISSVDDYNYSCGQDLSVMVYTSETNLSAYYYEVYDQGVASIPDRPVRTTSGTSTSSSSNLSNRTTSTGRYYSSTRTTSTTASRTSGTLVYNATVGPSLPLKIPTANLNESHRYIIKVLAADAAGNWATIPVESDGVIVTSENYSACARDNSAPQVTFNLNSSSCSETLVQMQYSDEISFKTFTYGQHASSTSCQATQTYQGQTLSFDSAGWLCYYVEDSMGNNYSGKRQIDFSDRDGDGIKDETDCDECLNTGAGKVVDESGCADGQSSDRTLDTDGDGLPDIWEKSFDKTDCSLDYLTKDSDADGLSDSIEDYDQDGYTNFEEYTNSYNPCLADLPTTDETDIYTSSLPKEKGIDILALIFLILGMLLVLGGVGYLVYYYTQKPLAPLQRPASRISTVRPTGKPGVLDSWKQKLSQLKKSRQKKLSQRQRSAVFSQFGKKSAEIPHLQAALQKRAPPLNKLHELAHHYAENKKAIQPGLRQEEKSIFSKLDSIAKQTKNKDISKVVSKGEAQDIFSKLRTISKKRKAK
ncbi:MAG: carboxypeptidase-like regulatory domain-containing protein [Nanoarchaeota archaeon]|nr:carboxypeptidase-like regulatory domain-containing protein [Nanoarchaeota archaeon]